MEYIRKTYNVPAKRGGRVMWEKSKNKFLGTITSATHLIYVKLDDCSKTKRYGFHPTDPAITYLENTK
jgi:hypothetical protein